MFFFPAVASESVLLFRLKILQGLFNSVQDKAYKRFIHEFDVSNGSEFRRGSRNFCFRLQLQQRFAVKDLGISPVKRMVFNGVHTQLQPFI